MSQLVDRVGHLKLNALVRFIIVVTQTRVATMEHPNALAYYAMNDVVCSLFIEFQF